ncbi:MAG: hypothetical protein HUU37_10680 [Bdellovibrionales bacterium]|nr:hypothetical protein [Bdellovibrionales bacterium]
MQKPIMTFYASGGHVTFIGNGQLNTCMGPLRYNPQKNDTISPHGGIVSTGRLQEKQRLRIKKFLGTSFNSVKAQIFVALIAYLLAQILRFQMKSSISTPDAMAVLGTLILIKQPISMLLGRLPRVTRHPCGSQLVLNL